MKKLLVALALVLSTAIFGTTACETKPVDKSSSSSSVEQSVSSSSNEETSSPEDSSSVEEPSNPETSSPEDSSSAEEPSNPETSSPEDSSSVEEPSNPETSSPENSSSVEDTSSSVEDSSSEEEKTFTVTLLNEDGTIFKVIEDVPEGTPAEVIYGGNYIPTKDGYIFDGWDLNGYTVKETDVVSQDLTLKAKFVASTYTITWIVEGVTSETNGIYDQKPVFEGETPTKAGDDKYVSYNFIGWTDGETTYAPDELPIVTGAQTYTAVFEGGEKQIYTITWVIGEYDERTSEIAYGEKTVYDGEAFTKEGDAQYVSYNFIGWTDGENTYAPDELPVVTGDQIYTAVFEGGELKQYTITWLNKDGTELSSGKVAYGTVPSYDGTPTFAPTAQYSYEFKSWDKEVVAVVGDATYTAVYEEIVNKYTITWVNEDGSVLETDTEVEYGATPSYDGEVPTKAEDVNYTYTFNAWSPEIAEVVGDATYTATYTAEGKLYTVNWVIGEKTLTSSVEYGKVPTFEGTSADLYKYGYEFIGWSDTADGEVITLPAVDGAETYYAVFSDTSVWDGTYPTLESGATADTLFDGEGTEASPYLIQSATDLAELSVLTNGKVYGSGLFFKLTINIDLSVANWLPICESNTTVGDWVSWTADNGVAFTGNFNGNGKTITFKDVNKTSGVMMGLFRALGTGATVANINFTGSAKVSGYYGAVASLIRGGNVTISNVTSGVVIESTISKTGQTAYGKVGNACAGGIIGIIIEGAGENIVFENCSNIANITGTTTTRNLGGLVGNIQRSNVVTFNNCSNSGTISGCAFLGGLTGTIEQWGTGYYTTVNFNDCVNTGAINGCLLDGTAKTATSDFGTVAPYLGYLGAQNNGSYDILFKVDGQDYKTVKVKYGNAITVDAPTKADDETYRYTFAGWSETEGGSVVSLPASTKEATYYAVFTKVELYTITWNVDGTETTSKYVAGETPEFTGSTAKEGYNFLGWATSAGGEVVEIPAVSENKTYYAKYEQVTAKYTVTWVGASGTLETDADVVHGSNPTYNGSTPTKDGYIFAGWALTEGGDVVDLATQIVDKDVSYYAIFTYSIWDGTYPDVTGKTEADVFGEAVDGYYIIDSAEDLAALAVLSKGAAYGSGLKFKQTVNIDLSKGGWYGIGDSNGALGGWISTNIETYGFDGEFDGNGKTVIMKENNNVNIIGLFWAIRNGTVKNLVIDGSISSAIYSGTLAARVCGSATIQNITNKATLTMLSSASNGNNYGGMIGFISNNITATINITDCVNEGNIVGTSNGVKVGGILGSIVWHTSGTITLTITNCDNKGNISGGTNVGGIIGDIEGQGSNGKIICTMTGCDNTGNITATTSKAGGIIGAIPGSITIAFTNNTHATGTITAGGVTASSDYGTSSAYAGYLLGQNAGTLTTEE